MVRRLVIDIPDELWQVSVSEHLPNRRILAGMIPVVVNDTLEQIASGVVCLLVIEVMDLLQLLSCECVEKRISEVRDGLPGFPHLGQRWSAGRLAIADQLGEVG